MKIQTLLIFMVFIVMGIAAAMGPLSDAGLNALSFVVPLVCFVYLIALSLRGHKSVVNPGDFNE